MSVATADHPAGTAIPSWRNTVDPSGFLISETRCSNWIPAYGLWPSLVNRRAILMLSSSGTRAELPVLCSIDDCERRQTENAGVRDAGASGLGKGRCERLFIYLVSR